MSPRVMVTLHSEPSPFLLWCSARSSIAGGRCREPQQSRETQQMHVKI